MPLADYQIAGTPDLSAEKFAAILRAGSSPAIVEVTAMYDALAGYRVHPSVFLGFFMVESRYGTVGVCKEFNTKNPGNVRTPEREGAAIVIDTPRGRFAKYATWALATADWCERLLGPKYAGAGLTTVRQVLPRYAPPTDLNDTEAYIKAVLASIESWVGKGAPPVALTTREAIIPDSNENRPGLPMVPKWITIHETANTSVGANAEMHRRFLVNGGGPEGVSFHWCVDDKEAVHLVPDNEVAWHAGDGTNGVGNRQSIAIETCVNSDGNFPKALANLAQLVALLMKRHGIPAANVVQHNKWSGKNCPTNLRKGAAWAGFLAAVQAAYALLNAPGGTGGGGNQIIPFIHTDGRPGVTILFDGQANQTPSANVADLGISVPSVTTGQMLDQSVQVNIFKGWKVRT